MEISANILASHERLSLNSGRFIQFVRQNPQFLKSENYNVLASNHPFLEKLQPWPTFISVRTGKEMETACRIILDLIKDIPRRMFSNDREQICNYYGMSADLADYFLYGLSDEHIRNFMARTDFIVTPSGLKFLEFNINSNLGGMDKTFLKSLHLSTPVVSRYLKGYGVELRNKNIHSVLFEHIVRASDRFYGSPGEINTAIVSPRGGLDPLSLSRTDYLNSLYNDLLKTHFDGRSGRFIICESSQLRVSGDEVFYENTKLHYIIEWCQGYLDPEIRELFKNGKILISNGAAAWIMSTKLNFVLLSENIDSGIFSPLEREAIKKYIPWTRKVIPGETVYHGETVRLEEFLLSNREKLLLKPSLGSGGSGIHIGRHTSIEEWRKVVETALKPEDWRDFKCAPCISESQWLELAGKAYCVKNWVVQEYIEPAPFLYKLDTDGCGVFHTVWGFFFFGSLFGGGWVRVLPADHEKGVINRHQGAKISVVFEVDT
jgi:hypothetical protein